MISKKEFEYTVGRNLAKYRNEKKLTQMQVAEMAELSVPFYASVELGNKGLSAYSLYKLSAALGVDINCLLSDDAENSHIPEFEACITAVRNWSEYILNSFDVPYSNGFTEGCNNKTKVLKRICFGVRSFPTFRNRILHCAS